MGAIDVKTLALPADVEMKEMKTAVLFRKGDKKAYLKGCGLELTNPTKELGNRVRRYTEEIIEKCHLGSVQAIIPGIADTIDLQKVLARYFKTAKPKSKKAKIAPVPAVAADGSV